MDAATHPKLYKLLVLTLLFAGMLILIALPMIVYKTIEVNSNEHLSETSVNRDKAAFIISTNHYKAPNFNEVFEHTSSIRALNDYLNTLDPYSKYLTSDEVSFFDARNRKYRVGIGLDFLINGDKILAVPVSHGPASKAGMVLPAYIQSIDGKKIVYSDFASYAFLTKLPVGKQVKLNLMDTNNLDKTSYTITAARYNNEPLSYSTYSDTLIIHISKFTAGLNSQLKEILESARQYQKLVFDLRHCPGGDLYAMVDMLSFILPENLPVATIVKEKENSEITLKTLPDSVTTGLPLYILVSEFTASTAELFTWAIKTYDNNAIVVGEPTKGKCLAQETFRFDDGSALKLTTFEVRNASNEHCQGIPIVPDKQIHGIALSNTKDIINSLLYNSHQASDK